MRVETTLPRALAVVAAHGATDFNEVSCFWDYALVSGAMSFSPEWLTMTVFLSASIVHFENDLGKRGSLVLHCGVACVGALFGPSVAFASMTMYIAVVHVPLHYIRCFRRRRFRGLFAAASATAILLLKPEVLVKEGSFAVTQTVQKIVIAHVVHELKLQ